MSDLAKKISFMLFHGQFRMIAGRLSYRLYSNDRSYGLRRDLSEPFTPPPAQMQLSIRPIEEQDVPFLFNTEAEGLPPHEREEVMARLLLLRSNIPTCYVAATEEGKACFAGWLFKSGEGPRLREYFKNGFPDLQPDEALFEFAYTHPAYRGKHVMPWAMAKIAEQVKCDGVRWVFAFADHRNASSLKRCRLAGFEPHLVRNERCRLFKRSVSFEPFRLGMLDSSGDRVPLHR